MTPGARPSPTRRDAMVVALDARDQRRLAGEEGAALRWAMDMLVACAAATDARRLIDVTRVHLVGSYHTGPANLELVARLADAGARVAIPTTTDPCGRDLAAPGPYGEDDDYRGNVALVGALQRMGCGLELTCAPYHLPDRPARDERIAWAESNAVVFANSVLGARTNATFQYLDLAAALTGRIPESGLYLDEERAARVVVDLHGLPMRWLGDAAVLELVGYALGARVERDVSVLVGLPPTTSEDALRGLGAAAASSGRVTLFHAAGITPEAPSVEAALHGRAPRRELALAPADLLAALRAFGEVRAGATVAAVCLGTPHFSLAEFERLLALLAGRHVAPSTSLVVTTSRATRAELVRRGLLDQLSAAGAHVHTDVCTYAGRQLGPLRGTVLTSSAKWAHYAAANHAAADVRFARLADCVESAVRGEVAIDERFWDA